LPELPPLAYLDASALVKLVVPECESSALRIELAGWPRRASSALTRAELVRACTRIDSAARNRARDLLDGLSLLSVTERVLDEAASIRPVSLRTLDAIHIATALVLRDTLGALITYDDRMADAATRAGLRVLVPA
jgi:predicted nucleic acid-binding protein